jgi:hypothetical protein
MTFPTSDDGRGVCQECGDRRRLTPAGVCVWRHGCEHRQMQHTARVGRLLTEMEHREAMGRHPGAHTHPFAIGIAIAGDDVLEAWLRRHGLTPPDEPR